MKKVGPRAMAEVSSDDYGCLLEMGTVLAER